MAGKRGKVIIAKRFKGLSKKNQEKIDILIMSERNRGYSQLSRMILELYQIQLNWRQVKYRLQQLDELEAQGKLPYYLKKSEVKTLDEFTATDETGLVIQQNFETMEQRIRSLMDIDESTLKPEEKKAVIGMKRAMNSSLRVARELFAEVPYVGYLNYAINVMQLRIAQRLEMEAKLGLPLKEVAVEIESFVGLIEKAIKLQQSIGLMPFVDTKKGAGVQVNVQTNVQTGGEEKQVVTKEEIESVPADKRSSLISKALDLHDEQRVIEADFRDFERGLDSV